MLTEVQTSPTKESVTFSLKPSSTNLQHKLHLFQRIPWQLQLGTKFDKFTTLVYCAAAYCRLQLEHVQSGKEASVCWSDRFEMKKTQARTSQHDGNRESDSGVVKCFLCCTFAWFTFADVRHIGAIQSCEPGLLRVAVMAAKRSSETFTHTKATFTKCIQHFWKAWSLHVNLGTSPPPPNTLGSDESDVDDPGDLSDSGDMLRDTQQSPPLTQEESVRRSGALFYFEDSRRATADSSSCQRDHTAVDWVVDTVEARVMETLQNSTIDSAEIDSVRACFHDKVTRSSILWNWDGVPPDEVLHWKHGPHCKYTPLP